MSERFRGQDKQRQRAISASMSEALKHRYNRDRRPSGQPYLAKPRTPRTAVWYAATELPYSEVYARTGLIPERQKGEQGPAVVAEHVTYFGNRKAFRELDKQDDGELIRNAYPPVVD